MVHREYKLVGVKCSLDEPERRELARGDRAIGLPDRSTRRTTCDRCKTDFIRGDSRIGENHHFTAAAHLF
ncbi:phosphotransferase-like protein [Paenibacillus cookii]|uniref:phosphotransferase-like protein n=1 Tax=Paenibacillus cookii TaxID=157839 RepID=UPI001BB39320